MTFCNQRLPSAICHLTLADLLYSADELQPNIATFVVDLFDSLETAGVEAAVGGSSGAASGGLYVTGKSFCVSCPHVSFFNIITDHFLVRVEQLVGYVYPPVQMTTFKQNIFAYAWMLSGEK